MEDNVETILVVRMPQKKVKLGMWLNQDLFKEDVEAHDIITGTFYYLTPAYMH